MWKRNLQNMEKEKQASAKNHSLTPVFFVRLAAHQEQLFRNDQKTILYQKTILCRFTGKRIVHRIPGVQYFQNDRSNDGAYNNQKNDGCEEGFMKKTYL